MHFTRRDVLTIGLVLISLGALGIALLVPRTIRISSTPITSDHGRYLEATYGPDRYSLGPEEWIIREVLKEQRNGVFVDVGAADARVGSNTYYLESALGWSGLAIEPQTEFAADYARYRPRTMFRPLFVSDVSDASVPFYVSERPFNSSAVRAHAEVAAPGTSTPLTVRTITLDDLLEREGITAFDLLSMDIELHEPQALAGFSIDRFAPQLVVVEAVPEIQQPLLDYFTHHGYVLLAKYLRVDEYNFYFVPLGRAPS